MDKPWLAHYEDVVPRTLTYPEIPVHKILDDTAARYANRPAVHLLLGYRGPLSLGCRLTYAQLLEQTDRFAAALHALGVHRGDRVGVMLPNLPQFVIAFFGAMKLGA